MLSFIFSIILRLDVYEKNSIKYYFKGQFAIERIQCLVQYYFKGQFAIERIQCLVQYYFKGQFAIIFENIILKISLLLSGFKALCRICLIAWRRFV